MSYLKTFKSPINFSDLYWKYNSVNQSHIISTEYKHPFQFLENGLENHDKFEFGINGFVNKFQTLLSLKSIQNEIYTAFEFEYMFLESNKTKYLNKLVSKLFVIIKEHEKKSSLIDNRENYKSKFLKSIAQDILKNIFVSYHLSLNKANRNRLSKSYYLKEPIPSFKLNSSMDYNRLERLFNKFLRKKFVAYETEFYTFRLLFENVTLENKINWIEDKSSLYYFIRLLILENVVKNPKNKHWEI